MKARPQYKMKILVNLYILLVLVSFPQFSVAAWEHYEKAVQFYTDAQFDSAIYYASKIETQDSLYFYSQLMIGHAYLELDSLEQAKKTFEPLLSFHEKRFFVYNGIGLYHLLKYRKSRGMTRLVTKLFSNDDLKTAQSYFERAIEAKSDYVDARLNYNRVLLTTQGSDQLQTAHTNLQKLASQYPDNLDIQYYLGVCKEEMNDLQGAVQVFESLLKKNPYHSLANLSLAFVYLEMEKFNLFSKRYLQGCVGLYDREWIQRLLDDIVDILPTAEQKIMKTFRIDGDFFLNFWTSRDPNPITEENERLIEHYRRLEYARNQYPGKDISAYDDRGKIYVRYGEPDDYQHSLSTDGSFLEKETWIYNIGSDTYNFDFAKKDAFYVLVKDLGSVIKDPTISRFNIKLEGDDLGFDFDSFKFFDTAEEKWFLEIYYGLNLRQIPFEFSTSKYKGELEESLLIKKSNIDPGIKTTNNVSILSEIGKQNGYYVRKVRTPLSVGRNIAYFQLKNKPTNKFRMVQSQIWVSVIKENQFGMSDIIISDDIHVANPEDDSLFVKNGYYIQPVPSRGFNNKGSIFCYFELYNLNRDLNNKCLFQIEYKIIEHETRQNLSSLLSTSNFFGSENQTHSSVAIVEKREFLKSNDFGVMAFDVSKLDPGVYSFEVKLTDLNSKKKLSENKILRLF